MYAAIIVGPALVAGVTIQNPEVPVAPLPRLVAPAVELQTAPGGYRVLLNRKTAVRLGEVLDETDEKEIAALLRELATMKDDADEAAKLNLAAFFVASQMPGFKKSLKENLGPGGAAITVTGLQKPEVKTGKRRLDRAFRVLGKVSPLLPDQARETVDAIRAMARTTPITWTVEPRK
jgi:hypothetical protein